MGARRARSAVPLARLSRRSTEEPAPGRRPALARSLIALIRAASWSGCGDVNDFHEREATMVDTAKKVWTDEKVLALPNNGREYELVHRELLMPPSKFWIERVVLSLGGKSEAFASKHALAECSGANGGDRLGPDVPLAPVSAWFQARPWTRLGRSRDSCRALRTAPSRSSRPATDRSTGRRRHEPPSHPAHVLPGSATRRPGPRSLNAEPAHQRRSAPTTSSRRRRSCSVAQSAWPPPSPARTRAAEPRRVLTTALRTLGGAPVVS